VVATIDDVRSRRAREALREGRRLSDVAASLGYESTSTFVRAFRRWTGETPAAWRARRGEAVPDDPASDVTAPARSTPT
jgi:AraC-like DNA-binding protein